MQRKLITLSLIIVLSLTILVYAGDTTIETIINSPPNVGYSTYVVNTTKNTFSSGTSIDIAHISEESGLEFAKAWLYFVIAKNGTYQVNNCTFTLEKGCYLPVPYEDSAGVWYVYVYRIHSDGLELVYHGVVDRDYYKDAYQRKMIFNSTKEFGYVELYLYNVSGVYRFYDEALKEALDFRDALDSTSGDSKYAVAWGKFSGDQPIELKAIVNGTEISLFTWGGGEVLYTVHIFKNDFDNVTLSSNNNNYTLKMGTQIRIEDENFYPYTTEETTTETTTENRWLNFTVNPSSYTIKYYNLSLIHI